jgi:hypothetical protein
LDAFFAGVFGFDPTTSRVPGMVFGMLAIASVYVAGRQWFSSGAGLMAAAVMSLSPEPIAWGARARMYSLWMWLFLLATFWLASGTLWLNSKPFRCLGITALIASAFSHILTLGYAIPLGAGLALGWVVSRWRPELAVRVRDLIWPESGLLALGTLLLLFFRRLGGQWGISERAMVDHSWFANPLAMPARALAAASPFFRPPLFITGLFAITGVFLLMLRLARHPEPSDGVLLCLVLLFAGSVTGLGTLSRYYADRYVFALFPIFAVVAGRELAFAGDLLGQRSSWLVGLGAPLLLVVGSLGPTAWITATEDPINIDQAYAFVAQRQGDRDLIATTTPAAATLYLGGSDVYIPANPDGPCTTGTDKWVGVPRYTCSDDFAAALAAEPRVWFVVDDWFWEHSLPSEFRDLVQSQMNLVFHPVGARVYLHDD